MTTDKRCPDCEQVADFHVRQWVCKKCNYLRVKAWRKLNPERAREQYRRNKLAARVRRLKREKAERLAVFFAKRIMRDRQVV